MKMIKIWMLVGIILITGLLAAGCGSAAAETQKLIEIPASNINFLIGVWEIEIDNTNYRMELTTDGKMLVGTRAAPTAFVNGPFRLEGSRLVDTSMPSCDALYDLTVRLEPGAQMPGLHFKLVGEDCEASRVKGLDGKTLYPYPEGF